MKKENFTAEEYLKENVINTPDIKGLEKFPDHLVDIDIAFEAVQMAKEEAIDSMRPELEIFAKQVRERQIQEVREWLFDVAERGGKKDLFTLFDERFLKVKK